MTLSSIYRRLARRRWSALALLVTAQFMVILDVAVVNVALPSIKVDLGFSSASLQWVVSAYAILFGGDAAPRGTHRRPARPPARVHGRPRALLGGSLACGLAWSEASLIVLRGVQGLGGALLAPAALALLMTSFPEGRERNRALGIYGAASGSGGAAGVLLGGVITSYLHWSWIFFINVPVGLAAMALAPLLLRRAVPRSRTGTSTSPGRPRSRRADAVRLRADAGRQPRLGLAGTLGLIAASARPRRRCSSWIEHRAASPLLPLRHLPAPDAPAANVTMAIVGAATFSEFFVLTLYLQDVLHYSAIQSGVAFVAFAGTVVVVSNLAQRVIARFGVRATLTAGLVAGARPSPGSSACRSTATTSGISSRRS